MPLNKEKKQEIVNKFAKSENDTGSCEVQVALLTERIKQISEHLKVFKKDKHSKMGLLKLLARRKAFVGYLKKNDASSCNNLLKMLKN